MRDIDNFKVYELSHIDNIAICSMRASYYMLYLSIALYQLPVGSMTPTYKGEQTPKHVSIKISQNILP